MSSTQAKYFRRSFWSYELSKRYVQSFNAASSQDQSQTQEAISVLLCGGLAGVATWVSIFPLGKQQPVCVLIATSSLTRPTDVIKTRLQIHNVNHSVTPDSQPLLNQQQQPTRPSTFSIARSAYQSEGAAVFFRGIGICSARAFIVNAVQWGVSTSYLECTNTPKAVLISVCLQVYEWIMKSLNSSPAPSNA
jgi:solute carrier family 25 carnitine/acylcarnitine transporter 20/29